VFKRPATPVRRPSRREIRRKIERHQDSKRDLQKGSRVISQQGNEAAFHRQQTGSQQGNGHSLHKTAEQAVNKAADTAFHKTAEQAVNKATDTAFHKTENRQSTRKRVQPSQESRITENVTVCKIRKSTSEKAVPKPNQSV
jgi:hypothetical protein